MNSRYYDPEVGRFINADGILGTANAQNCDLYSYCAYNPINDIDPTGLCGMNYLNDNHCDRPPEFDGSCAKRRPWIKSHLSDYEVLYKDGKAYYHKKAATPEMGTYSVNVAESTTGGGTIGVVNLYTDKGKSAVIMKAPEVNSKPAYVIQIYNDQPGMMLVYNNNQWTLLAQSTNTFFNLAYGTTMEGRTISGIGLELKAHYMLYKMRFQVDQTYIADIDCMLTTTGQDWRDFEGARGAVWGFVLRSGR